MMNDSKVKGVYTAEKKYEKIWLTDAKTKSEETLDYFYFTNLLTQAFSEKQKKVILDELNCMRKVILDFDNGIAKRIVDKNPDFMEGIKPFFSPSYIQRQLDDPFNDSINMYNPEESKEGGFSV